MVYSPIQHPPTPPPTSRTLSVYTVHLVWAGGGAGEVREKVEGQLHRVETAAFWRTFSDEGKISPGW
jgi:hypothetical protein